MSRLRPRLTYANVTSSLALVVALTGGAYAATQLPKNSVGPKQIKKNAVKSSKVKNHSLLSRDFKAGQLPRGPKGDKGDTGGRGPSDAYDRTGNSQIDNLPAGSYALSGKENMTTTGSTATSLSCDLVAIPSAGGSSTTLDHAQTKGTSDIEVTVEALKTFSAPQTIAL